MSDDLAACAALLQRGDPDRFLAAMAAPSSARSVLLPLYAMNVEVSRAPWVVSEPHIAEMRLQWWRDALDEIANGATVRRHEVVTPLADFLDDPACAELDDLILARRWDIYRDPFDDQTAFQSFLEKTAGGLMWVAARALGAPEASRDTVIDIGYAHGLANWFRAIPALEAAGRFPLVDGRPEAVETLACDAEIRLQQARKAQGTLPRVARSALFPAWQSGAILRQVSQASARVADGALGLSAAGSRLRLIMAAVRGRI